MATITTTNSKMSENDKQVRNENAKKDLKKAFTETHVYFTDKKGTKFSVITKYDKEKKCAVVQGSNYSGDCIAVLTKLENGHILVTVCPKALKDSRVYTHKKELCSKTKSYLETCLNHYTQFVMFDDFETIITGDNCKGVKIVGDKYKKIKLEETSVGNFEKKEVEYICEFTKTENDAISVATRKTREENKKRSENKNGKSDKQAC